MLNPKLEYLGDYAFSETGLKVFEVPSGVTRVGDGVLSYCKGLEYVTIDDGVSEIGAGSFYNCESLRAVWLPDSVRSLDDDVFAGCSSLGAVRFGPSIESTGAGTFDHGFFDESGREILTPQELAGKSFSLEGDRFVECEAVNVTVKFVDGGKAVYPAISVPVKAGERYSFAVPEIDGKTAKPGEVSGIAKAGSGPIAYVVEYADEGSDVDRPGETWPLLVALVAVVGAAGVLVFSSRRRR